MITDIKGYAEHLKISAYTVGQEIRAGNIPAFKVGGSWRIDVEEADAFLKSNTFSAAKPAVKYSKRKQTAKKMSDDFLATLNQMSKEVACGL